MKIRNTFITNSSSASYTVITKGLSEEQISNIRNHCAYAKERGWTDRIFWEGLNDLKASMEGIDEDSKLYKLLVYFSNSQRGIYPSMDEDCPWGIINEGENHIEFYTVMDNFDFETFMKLFLYEDELNKLLEARGKDENKECFCY